MMSDFLLEETNLPLKHPVEKIPNKYQDYLMHSKLRNQKLQEGYKHPPKSSRVIQLEEGFSLYFNGANSELSDKKDKATAVAPRKSKTCEERGKAQTERSKSGSARPTWGSATKLGFLTDRGDKWFVRPSNYYSEDFEDFGELDEEKGEIDNDEIDEEITEEINEVTCNRGGVSMDLSMNDVRYLRQSLDVMNSSNRDVNKVYERLDKICEDEERIMTLELRLDTDNCVDDNYINDGGVTGGVSLNNDARLKEIIDRVLKMNLNQQEKLLNTLERIEETVYHHDNIEEEKKLEIAMIIEDNWGHPSRVGLTEVEFLDGKRRQIKIISLRIENEDSNEDQSSNVGGSLTNIINNKTNTAKEKYMWSTRFDRKKCLTIHFNLASPSIDCVHFLVVYNFNKCGDGLSIGVRKLQLRIADNILCSSIIIDKSAGNMAFNPPTIVELQHNLFFHQPLNTITSLSSIDLSSDDECLMDKFHNANNCFNKQYNLVPPPYNNNNNNNNTTIITQQQQQLLPQDCPQQLTSLPADNNSYMNELLCNKQYIDISYNKLEEKEDKDLLDRYVNMDCNNYYNNNSNSKKTKDKDKIIDKIEDQLIKEENNMRRASAKFGRRSELEMCEGRDQLKELVEEFETTPFDNNNDNNDNNNNNNNNNNKSEYLEKSWSSLNFFNKSHAGRLSLDHTGDSLDKYVDEIRRDNICVTKNKLVEEEFIIPELPRGQEMRLNILSTWGDPHYVGLTGIEMFTSSGQRANVKTISAQPRDINILAGYGNDPRVVKNLLDGVNRTRDDVHMWLAPFTANNNHLVTITFVNMIELALLRIWNYNKSRIHSSRGARDVEITLDGVLIFKGEIAAVSSSNEIEDYGEVILFTTDDITLDKIGMNDQEFVQCNSDDNDDENKDLHNDNNTNDLLTSLQMRPTTAKQTLSQDKKKIPDSDNSKIIGSLTRPFTSTRPSLLKQEKKNPVNIKLRLIETWGDQFYIGLNGIEFLDEDGNIIPIDGNKISTNMETLNNDVRKLVNIIDGDYLTSEDEHIWLAPFNTLEDNLMNITIETRSRISVIKIWNYNKSLEDSYRGVKYLHLWIDEKQMSPEDGYLLRRAPGHCQYDFAQEINFNIYDNPRYNFGLDQQLLPCGFVYQFNIFSSWNDLYYVGLNGLQFYDHLGLLISLHNHQVYAYPDSVNSLTPKNQLTFTNIDVRTPDKLVDGVNDTYDPKHMWLAPILPGCLNKIFVVFDRPVVVSMIQFWNYSKSPSRGVKDFSILVNDLVIYSGTLPCATSANVSRGILPNMNDTIAPCNIHRTVLFDRNNTALMAAERFHILEHSLSNGQEVILINDSDVSRKQCANQKHRPMTSVKGRTKVK